MSEIPVSVDKKWRNEDGTLKPGHPVPEGWHRPKGQSLKEYWRQKFSEMTPEEKEEFTKRVGKETIWQMAEGRPPQPLEHSGKDGEDLLFKVILTKDGDGDSITPEAEPSDGGQPQV